VRPFTLSGLAGTRFPKQAIIADDETTPLIERTFDANAEEVFDAAAACSMNASRPLYLNSSFVKFSEARSRGKVFDIDRTGRQTRDLVTASIAGTAFDIGPRSLCVSGGVNRGRDGMIKLAAPFSGDLADFTTR
jgi:hypothetical protein